MNNGSVPRARGRAKGTEGAKVCGRTIGAERGVPVFDTAEIMQRPDVEALILDPCHFTCEGAEVFAEALFDELTRTRVVSAK